MTHGSNPWLSAPLPPESDAPLYVAAPVAGPRGPVAPQRSVPAPDRVDQLPIHDRRQAAELWCLGVHGGAGETSLASLVPEWAAAGHGWPRPLDGAPAPVVLAARSNMRGLRAAQLAATQWAAGLVPHVEVLGLVLVADAPGRLPRPLRDFSQLVAGGVPRVWSVPWIEAWRLGEQPAIDLAPHAVRRVVADLTALLQARPTRTID